MQGSPSQTLRTTPHPRVPHECLARLSGVNLASRVPGPKRIKGPGQSQRGGPPSRESRAGEASDPRRASAMRSTAAPHLRHQHECCQHGSHSSDLKLQSPSLSQCVFSTAMPLFSARICSLEAVQTLRNGWWRGGLWHGASGPDSHTHKLQLSSHLSPPSTPASLPTPTRG